MDKEKLLKIASLSKLSFNQHDLGICLSELNELEDYIHDIQTKDSDAEAFNSFSTDISSLRADEVTSSLDQAIVLDSAIDSVNGLIKLSRRKGDV